MATLSSISQTLSAGWAKSMGPSVPSAPLGLVAPCDPDMGICQAKAEFLYIVQAFVDSQSLFGRHPYSGRKT